MNTREGKSPRIAVIGAGPIGLEAALYGRLSGWSVKLFERGRVAAHVRDWGHVRLFSPWNMNTSSWSRDFLAENDSDNKPSDPDACPTGCEFVDRYLLPLSRCPLLTDVIHEQTTVLGVTRSRSWKGDRIGHPARAHDPFRLLLEGEDGRQRDEYAEIVLDCSGVYANHNWLGAGGLAAVGERAFANEIDYRLPDVLGNERHRFADKTTLVVGGGYSAATAVVNLAKLAETFPNTRAIWITRDSRTPPITEIKNDPLPERRNLTARGNQLAMQSGGAIHWEANHHIAEIKAGVGRNGCRVTVRAADVEDKTHEFAVDCLIANIGFRPDRSLYEELQIHECYASSGPMKMAAALLGETSDDCLNQSSGDAELLRNPEPGFFILGAKSYGRDSRFLIRTGIEQIREVYAMIASDPVFQSSN